MSKKYSIFICGLFALFIGGFLVLQVVIPDREFSPQENRYLAQLPQPKAEDFALAWPVRDSGDFFTGKLMEEYETYITEQFPFRDSWIAAKARLETWMGKGSNNDVYIGREETLIPHFSQPDTEQVEKNLGYVEALTENVDLPVYFGLIPGKVSVWADRLPDNAPNASEGDILAQAQAAASAAWVDVNAALTQHAEEPIYYRLDHHWTSLGAYYGYAAIMEAMGITPVPLEAYQVQQVSDNFNGTAYSSSGVRWFTPDTIHIYVPEEGVTVETFQGPVGEPGVLYKWSQLQEKDQYSFFLGGSASLQILRTEHTEKPKLLVIRDSYSDSLAPFLTAHFSEIHLLDPRYNKTPVSQYVAQNGIDQVLVLYSVNNFVTDTNLFPLGM